MTQWQDIAPKPCPRCEGIPVTWGNTRLVHFCDKHLGEVIREIDGHLPIPPDHA
jgi:hypothetical protein